VIGPFDTRRSVRFEQEARKRRSQGHGGGRAAKVTPTPMEASPKQSEWSGLMCDQCRFVLCPKKTSLDFHGTEFASHYVA
jgi:hypothetical protein